MQKSLYDTFFNNLNKQNISGYICGGMVYMFYFDKNHDTCDTDIHILNN